MVVEECAGHIEDFHAAAAGAGGTVILEEGWFVGESDRDRVGFFGIVAADDAVGQF